MFSVTAAYELLCSVTEPKGDLKVNTSVFVLQGITYRFLSDSEWRVQYNLSIVITQLSPGWLGRKKEATEFDLIPCVCIFIFLFTNALEVTFFLTSIYLFVWKKDVGKTLSV